MDQVRHNPSRPILTFSLLLIYAFYVMFQHGILQWKDPLGRLIKYLFQIRYVHPLRILCLFFLHVYLSRYDAAEHKSYPGKSPICCECLLTDKRSEHMRFVSRSVFYYVATMRIDHAGDVQSRFFFDLAVESVEYILIWFNYAGRYLKKSAKGGTDKRLPTRLDEYMPHSIDILFEDSGYDNVI